MSRQARERQIRPQSSNKHKARHKAKRPQPSYLSYPYSRGLQWGSCVTQKASDEAVASKAESVGKKNGVRAIFAKRQSMTKPTKKAIWIDGGGARKGSGSWGSVGGGIGGLEGGEVCGGVW